MAALYYGMIEEVRVMLVDYDKESAFKMVDLLKSYDYKVATVHTASGAMSMLSKGKKKIDVMIISVRSPNLHSFQLLEQSVALDIISLFVCDEHHELLAKKALDEGAFLYLKKPLGEEIVKYLWQFVLTKKTQRKKVRDGSDEENRVQGEEKNNVPNNTEEQSNNIEAENNVTPNGKRKRGGKSTKKINKGENQNSVINKVVRQKDCIKWTEDLHAKFVEVVQQLDDGSCFPKEILEGMNVPGLTKMQVASHLQKCRSNNWRAPKERKSICHSSRQGSSSGSQQRNSFKKYGTIPCLQKSAPSQTQRGSKFSFLGLNTDNIVARGESSIQQQLYHPQLQAQPHCLNIGNSLNNTSFWAQSNACGEIQQQHGSLVEMLGAKVLQDPIIVNTNHMPGLMLNSGNHHSQSDYKLDLNVAYGRTYSDVENGAINGLEAANANFQQYIGEPIMSNPSSAAATSYESDIKGSDSNKRNCDAYLDSSSVNYLFQNLGPSSADLSNEHDGSEFNQVYSDDQVTPTSNVE